MLAANHPGHYHSAGFPPCFRWKRHRLGFPAMFQDFAPAAADHEVRIVIRPNRSLSARQLRWICLAFAVVTGTVSVLGWLQGNAFAPLFAVIDVAVFTACLYTVWARSGRAEVIEINSVRICVRHLPELEDVFASHPAWVRLDTSNSRLVLYSAGRGCEVGGCLNEVERASLGRRLQELLTRARRAPAAATAVDHTGGRTYSNDDVVE